jgi:hypothetical protein
MGDLASCPGGKTGLCIKGWMVMKPLLNENTLPWLLEEENPGVRYLALRNILNLPENDSELVIAREKAHHEGPIATILEAMHPEGYWEEPGSGYLPKYTSTVWSIILLGQLGATIDLDPRIHLACHYLMEHAFNPTGQFSTNGPPSGTVDCLQGNLCAALLDLGYEDSRLDSAFEWMARTVTGEGVSSLADKKAPLRYYAGKCGPTFACGANNGLPCAWGAGKVMLAFSKLQIPQRTALIEDAIQQGIEFLLSVDPLDATYPSGWNDKPSSNWWKFGFPVFYVTDILQIVEALVGLGLGADLRLKNVLKYISSKQDQDGRWPLEYDYAGKTWYNFGTKKQPNKWVTYRAVRVLKLANNDE